MKKNSTKLMFLACGDVLYENGYKTRVFGEMKMVAKMAGWDKYFVSFEKPASFEHNFAQVEKITKELREIGFESFIMPRQNRWKIDPWLDVRKFAQILREINFDSGIIHTQSLYACYLAIWTCEKNHQIKIIYDAHGLVGPELVAQRAWMPMRWITEWVERKCILRSDFVITASDSLQKLIKHNYQIKNSLTLPCLADGENFKNCDFENITVRRKELNLPIDQLIAVYLGGMQQWQKFEGAVDFAQKNNLFLLVITNDIEKAKDICRGKKIEDCTIISLPHEKVGEYLKLADMGLLFRDANELNRIAWPTKVAEYLLCGLPIVHNDTVEDIGSIVTENNLGTTINNFAIFIEEYRRDSRKFKHHCRQYALKNLLWETKQEQLENVYQKLSKKKICFLVTSGFYGGAQKYNLDLADYFNHYDCNCEVVFGAEGETVIFENKLIEKEIEYKKLKYLVRAISPVADWLATGELIKYLRSDRPDILHISSSKAGILGRLAGWWVRIDQVDYTAHGWVFNEDIWWGKKYLYLLLERWLANYCDKIFCVSRYDLDLAVESGFDPSKLELIYNGIREDKISNSKFQIPNESQISKSESDLNCHPDKHKFPISNFQFPLNSQSSISNFQTRKKCYSGPESTSGALQTNHNLTILNQAKLDLVRNWKKENCKIIGVVANFFPAKNLQLFVTVAAQLLTHHQNYRFVMIGDGPLKSSIETLISEAKLEQYFCLTGQVDNWGKYGDNFDVFMLTSSKEGFPYILLEVGLRKIPIVASRVGGVGELIIDGKTGYVVDELEVDSFVEKIEMALASDNREMVDNLLQKIRREFDFDDMARKYWEVYEANSKFQIPNSKREY